MENETATYDPGWTAVVVNYNGGSYLEACLHALQVTRPAPNDIIVVDNASSDDSLAELHAFPRANILAQPINLGFAGGANAGLARVEHEIAVILNPDVEVSADFGAEVLRAFAADQGLGAAGAILLYPGTDRVQHAGGVIERPLLETRHIGYQSTATGLPAQSTDVEFVTGGAIGLRMTAVQSVGGFDTRFSPVYYEDADLCLRLREAGWGVKVIPTLRADHHEGVTLQRGTTYYRHIHRNRIRFALKHLSSAEWRHEFIPAELERLRHQLATLTDDDAPVRSGVDAIEALLRGVEEDTGWDAPVLAAGWPLRSGHIDIAYDLIDVRPESLSRATQRSRLRRLLSRLATRWYVDESFDRQRHFNAAVVQALHAHDHQHRSQTAALLLFALDALGRLSALTSEGNNVSPVE